MNAAKKIKVLHIDDDPTFIEIFKTMFGSAALRPHGEPRCEEQHPRDEVSDG